MPRNLLTSTQLLFSPSNFKSPPLVYYLWQVISCLLDECYQGPLVLQGEQLFNSQANTTLQTWFYTMTGDAIFWKIRQLLRQKL